MHGFNEKEWTEILTVSELVIDPFFLSSSMMLQLDNLYNVFLLQTVKNVLGPDLHAKKIGKIHLVQFASEGVFGWIPTHGRIISQFLSGD